jgi:DNA mismatch repair protein MutS2
MNRHALGVLEFRRVLDLVGGYAGSSLGRERATSIEPRTDRDWISAELGRVAACRALIASESSWSPETAPDLREPLGRLRIEGTFLSGEELSGAAALLASSRRTAEALEDPKRPRVATAVLQPIARRLARNKQLEDALGRAIAPDGSVRDEASPALRRLRRELQGAQGELVALLERAMSRLESHHQVSDMSVTVRNGRFVIPVRREGAKSLGGIVHDTSATGATLFVEPPAAVEFGNRIRELELEEQREVDRILRELSERVRPIRLELLDSLEALAELDSIYARAKFAIAFGCSDVELADPQDSFVLRSARHPLLLAQEISVVPFDLELLPDERTLLVSGPNTGGKTVLLKATGLISMMVQSGIPAPVGAESTVPVYDDVFADVGDEQSIEASLSTFSAHLKNLSEILSAATGRALVLVDELGSGTDPTEGAALGGAILENLTARGARTIATTHLGALKELAAEVNGVVNASLQFDEELLAPTYRLVKGIPGRSYGISIARRLLLPADVLQRAEERLPTAERDYNALLAELERRQAEIDSASRELAEMTDQARDRAARLAERERNVRNREREAERAARKEARQLVLDARAEVERTIRALSETDADKRDEAAREARRKMESLAATQADQLDRLEREELKLERSTQRKPVQQTPLAPGDTVEVTTLGNRQGQLLELRGKEAVVAVGGMKLTLPTERLRKVEKPRDAQNVVAIRGDMPEPEAASELDLRGMRADEIESILLRALDAAIRADLRTLRIIHGKGTGALRERVTEMLRKDTRVREFRLGAWNEGGAGVTLVAL